MEFKVIFSADEPFVKGHFPGNPVIPGVMLVDRAVSAAEKFLERKIALTALKKVKFTNPIYPNEDVLLKLELSRIGEILYCFSKNGEKCASGILVYRDS